MVPSGKATRQDVDRGELVGQELIQTILRRQDTMAPLTPLGVNRDTLSKIALYVARAAAEGTLNKTGNPLRSDAAANPMHSVAQEQQQVQIVAAGAGGHALEGGGAPAPAAGSGRSVRFDMLERMPQVLYT